eukprot:1161629-Pyramimonas_sp.AAC.1
MAAVLELAAALDGMRQERDHFLRLLDTSGIQVTEMRSSATTPLGHGTSVGPASFEKRGSLLGLAPPSGGPADMDPAGDYHLPPGACRRTDERTKRTR